MPNLSSFTPAHLHDITPISAEGPGVTVQMGISVTTEIRVGRPIGESFSLLDSPITIQRKFVRGVSESVTIEDDATRFMRANIILGESFTILDEVIRRLVQSKSVVDTLSIVALASRGLLHVPRAVSDSFTIAATGLGERLTFLSRSVSESLAITEDGFAEICKTAGQLKEIIHHKLGRFFSVLPQRNIRAYTFDSEILSKRKRET